MRRRAVLVVANVTPTGYNVGVFMANHARYAKTSDVRRNVQQGEIFTYWPQAEDPPPSWAVASARSSAAFGRCVSRECSPSRRRVRPCEASYVWSRPVASDVGSDVGSGGRVWRRVSYRTTYRTTYEPRTKQPAARASSVKLREQLAGQSRIRTTAIAVNSPLTRHGNSPKKQPHHPIKPRQHGRTHHR